MGFWKHYKATLYIISFAIIGLFQSFYPAFLSKFNYIQADFGDTRFNHYLLEHSYRWLNGSTYHQSLWNPPFFYPAKNSLAYSDMLLGAAPMYWVLRFIGISEILSYQSWMIIQQSLTYGLALLFLRRLLRCSWLAASFGGYIITFANARLAQLGHQQLLPLCFVLIILICAVELFCYNRKRWRWILLPLGGTCLFLQVITGFYYAWFIVLLLLLSLGVVCATPSLRRNFVEFLAEAWWPTLVTCLVCTLALIPIIDHYLLAVAEVGMRDFGEVAAGIPYLSHLLLPGRDNLLWGWTRAFWTYSLDTFYQEKQLGIGIITFLAALFGLYKIPSRGLRTLVLGVYCSAVFLVFVLPPEIVLWKYVYQLVPGAGAIRAPGRIVLLLLVVYGIGIAGLIEYGRQRNSSSFLMLLFAFIMVAEQSRFMPSYRVKHDRITVNRLARAIKKRKHCDAFFLLQEKARFPSEKYHLDAMWAGLRADVPTLNGYSGNSPNDWKLSSNIFTTAQEYDDLVQRARGWQAKIIDKQVCLFRRDRYGKISSGRLSDQDEKISPKPTRH